MTKHKLSDRQFGLMMAVVFLIFASSGWFFFDVILGWALIAAGAAGFTALVLPGVLLPFNRLWGVLAYRLGRALNFVLLSVFFYILVLPFGLIIRLSGRDPMHRHPDRNAKTYFTAVTRHTNETTLHDMF